MTKMKCKYVATIEISFESDDDIEEGCKSLEYDTAEEYKENMRRFYRDDYGEQIEEVLYEATCGDADIKVTMIKVTMQSSDVEWIEEE